MKQWIINNSPLICFITALTILALFLTCSGTSTQKKQLEQPATATLVYKKPPSSFNDTIVIWARAAVFYNADSLQLEKIKASIDTMIFESTIHDCFYQMRNAKRILKESWPQIKIVDISKARYLLFMKKDNSQECIDLDTQNDMCGLFLFNGIKKPQIVDMMNIATELDFYYKK